MKYSQKILLSLFFLGIGQFYGQNETLLEIIQSDKSLEMKQSKIDSFLLASNEGLAKMDLADIYHDLGLHWYYRNWNITRLEKYLLEAIAHTKKAAVLKSKIDPLDSISFKRSLYNLGYLQKLNDDLHASIESHLKIVELGGKDNRVKEAHQELGDTYRTIGDFQIANNHLEMALSIAENDIQNYAGMATAHIGLAESFSTKGYRENADKITFHLKKADSLLDKEGNRNIFIRAQIAQLRGNLLLMLENYESAKQHHLKVLEYSNSHPDEFSHTDLNFNLATIHNSIGVSYDKLDETNIAIEHFNRALLLNNKFSSTYENLGDLYLHLGEFEKGLLHYQKAIVLATDNNLEVKHDDIPSLEDVELSPEKIFLLSHIVSKANGWLDYYAYDKNKDHLQQALETFTIADQLVDLIRYVSNEQETKLYWREQSSALYMKAVKVCHLLDKPKDAFYFMERNKALLLLEDLTHEEAKDIAQLPQDLSQREFKLKRKIFLAENKLFESDNTNSKLTDSLKILVRDGKYKYGKFIDSLNVAFPEYARYKRNPEIFPYDALQSDYLTSTNAVIHYILNEEDGYGLLTTNEQSVLFRLEDVDQLNTSVEEFNALLVDGLSDMNTLNRKSHSLFLKVIPGAIYERIKGKQLIIVPDYTLQRLPFETLIVDAEQQKYLLEATEISYVYSMSLLALHQGLGKNTSEQFLGVAPVRFEPLGLAALNSSQQELTGIAGFFNSEVLLSNNATKANFLNRAIHSKIIHLATHADVGQGENPWIAFSDEKMFLKEIYATKTMSDMVVLSACNTSDGNLKRGEGVMSLARGFFYSGAKSVVSSLWPVTDESGKDLMISFYKNLDKGYSKSRALKAAKLNYLKTTSAAELKHPFYWAGFVVLGDNAPLIKSSVSYWTYTAIVVLLALIYFFRKKLFKRLQ